MPVDKFGRMSDTKTKDTGVSLTYINNNYIRSDGGTPVSGSINMNGNTLTNVSDPVNRQDVATKEYVDDVAKFFSNDKALLKENGGYSIDGVYLNMNYNNNRNLGTPVNDVDAATKGYVDNTVEPLKESLNTIDKRPHIIVVHSNYCGLLRKGEYQFVFWGNIMQPTGGVCGFLMPHSGRIKKIKVKISHDEGIENLRKIKLNPSADLTEPEPSFTFTLIKEEKKAN